MTNINIPFDKIIVKESNGKERKISEYFINNKLLMIVNIGTPCGYTNFVMKSLVDIHNKYNKKGLEILAFPCILSESSKCEVDFSKYGQDMFKINFPIFSIIEINGKNIHPLYRYLKRNWINFIEKDNKLRDINFNFCKFIVNKEGKILSYYDNNVDIAKIDKEINKMLKAYKL